MVVIGSDGMVGDHVLDVSEEDDPPVRVRNGGQSTAGDLREIVADNFVEFFQSILQVEAAPAGSGARPGLGDRARIVATEATGIGGPPGSRRAVFRVRDPFRDRTRGAR